MAIGSIRTELSAYVPRWVGAVLCDPRHHDDAPFAEGRRAAVLFLDIAGFTETTDRLAKLGARGAEELSNLLDDCFAALTDVIDYHGGDVIAFAGDGILALWAGDEIADACHLAAQCGLTLQSVMRDWARSRGNNFGQRISVDVGEVYLCRVGGFAGQWRFVVAGPPIQRVGAVYRKGSIGEVLLCADAWHAIARTCEGHADGDIFHLAGLISQPEFKAPAPYLEPPLNQLRALVPAVVRQRLPLGGRWVGEFRNVTVLFINFLNVDFGNGLLELLQQGVFEAQRGATRLEGSFLNLLMDDKGISIALAFGMPPFAHEEDPLRAIEAALAIHHELDARAIRTSMGIASGRLFCGDYGGRSRREYSAIGQAINISARLMELADGDVLCDAATAQAVQGRVTFSVLPALHLKGRTEPLAVFRPIALVSRPRLQRASDMVGRQAERQRLRSLLAELNRGQGGVVVIRGEAGIGKSRLLAELVDEMRTEGLRILQGFATAIDKSTPYFAWRNVMQQLINVDAAESRVDLAATLIDRLKGDETLLTWLPLLGDIIPVEIAETALTRQINGSARAASIEGLIVALLGAPDPRPTLLLFEDLHWFDGASLSLLAAVARRLPHLLIIATTRTHNAATATSELRAVEFGRTQEMLLEALPHDAVAELVRRRLRASHVPPALISFIHDRCGGNPFYCEELTLALRDTRTIGVTRGVCQIQGDLANAAITTLSASLEGAIVSRLDALPLEAQLLLKVASAIGTVFAADMLRSIYPGSITLTEIDAALERLVELEILRIQDAAAARSFAFRHVISHEVTYNLLSFAQRRTLHKTIATTLETVHAGRLEPLFGQLAQHWERADEKARAAEYLELAAEQALRSYANYDAIRYISKAISWADDSAIDIDAARLSGWEVILGDAYNEMADYDTAPPHYERALLLLGQRVSKRPGERIGPLLRNAVLQVRNLLVSPNPQRLIDVDRQKCRRAAHVRERLSEQHFFRNESLAVLDETLAALNLAERCGAIGEIISGYNALAVGLGISGLLAPARFYSRRALRLAQDNGGLPDVARAHIVAAVLGYGLGEWEFTERCAGRAMALLAQLGDRARWHAPLTIAIFVAFLRGDLATVDRLLAEFSGTISPDSSDQSRAWHLAAQVLAKLMRSETDVAELKQLRQLAEAKQVQSDQLLCLGIVASAYLQRRDMSNALEAADRGLAVLRESSVVWGGYVYGVAGVTEVLLADWAMVESDASGSPARAKALEAWKHAARVTRTSPVCRPQALLLKGRVSFLSGKLARARREWRQAAAAAEKLEMRREIGLAMYEIGRTTAPDDPRRTSNLTRAADIFQVLGARADLAETRRAMSA
jgi:class 3 adenylate cyclase/tetratricopeptide (TPR) repeat protein